MKATKVIKKAVEKRFNLNKDEYEIYYQARMFSEGQNTYDVAIILFDYHFYVIRAWQNGCIKCRALNENEKLLNAFMKYLNLDE